MHKFQFTCYSKNNETFLLTVFADTREAAKAKAEKMVDSRCIGTIVQQ